MYNGIEIPELAIVKTSEMGREYYITGLDIQGYATIRFLDNGEFINVKRQRVGL